MLYCLCNEQQSCCADTAYEQAYLYLCGLHMTLNRFSHDEYPLVIMSFVEQSFLLRFYELA